MNAGFMGWGPVCLMIWVCLIQLAMHCRLTAIPSGADEMAVLGGK